MSRDYIMTGRSGEKRFSTLCSDAGITCIKSDEDDAGWDMMMYFPQRRKTLAALDMQPGQRSALVQIKATKGSGRSVSLSLSNALRYVQAEQPTFIVLVVLKGSSARYFVRHVWFDLIAQWLKAARLADARGVTKTHRESVTLSFAPEDEKSEEELLRWMEKQIGGVSGNYGAIKEAFAQTAGFETSYGTATFTLDGPGERDMLDLQLGLKPYLTATRFTYRSERFGIPARNAEIDVENARISIEAGGSPVTVRMEFHDGESVALAGTMYHADTGRAQAWRITTQCLEILYDPDSNIRMRATLGRGVPVGIADLSAFAKARKAPPGSPVHIEILKAGSRYRLGSFGLNDPSTGPSWDWLDLEIDVLKKVEQEAKRHLPAMSISSINSCWQDFMLVSALAAHNGVKMEFTPEPGIPRKFATFLGYRTLEIEGSVLGVVASRRVVTDRKIRGRREIYAGPGSILYAAIEDASAWDPAGLEAAYQRHLDRLSLTGDVFALKDLSEFLNSKSPHTPFKRSLPSAQAIGSQ